MSAAVLAAVGWAAALAALATVAVQRVAWERRMALVAEAAHELRRPLSAALLGLHGVGADAAGARRVAAVALELRRAGLALEDLDAAPRGRRAPDCDRPLDVRALLAEAVDGWRPLAGALASELLFDAGGPRLLVRADRLRLTQAVGNVVANALEHGAGPVRVRAHATRTHVRIEVRDHGPGLPAPVAALARGGADLGERGSLAALFGGAARRGAGGPLFGAGALRGAGGPLAALYGAVHRTRASGGFPLAGVNLGRRGHGLAIAARIVARHGGRLLTAPVSSGACVVLELPRAELVPRGQVVRARRRRNLAR
jgi:signal transduction histidine kinase